MLYNVTVRPDGAVQEHQNVNSSVLLHAALFEVEHGPCFQLPTVPLQYAVQQNLHKCTEGSVF